IDDQQVVRHDHNGSGIPEVIDRDVYMGAGACREEVEAGGHKQDQGPQSHETTGESAVDEDGTMLRSGGWGEVEEGQGVPSEDAGTGEEDDIHEPEDETHSAYPDRGSDAADNDRVPLADPMIGQGNPGEARPISSLALAYVMDVEREGGGEQLLPTESPVTVADGDSRWKAGEGFLSPLAHEHVSEHVASSTPEPSPRRDSLGWGQGQEDDAEVHAEGGDDDGLGEESDREGAFSPHPRTSLDAVDPAGRLQALREVYSPPTAESVNLVRVHDERSRAKGDEEEPQEEEGVDRTPVGIHLVLSGGIAEKTEAGGTPRAEAQSGERVSSRDWACAPMNQSAPSWAGTSSSEEDEGFEVSG
ncbi:unnamed protein product, partial [Discosporangium mesarthrocarpum]